MSRDLVCIVMMFIMLSVNLATAQTIADVTSLYTDLSTGYDTRVRPTADDQHQALNMTLTFSLNFIKVVDVTTGEFTVIGSVTTQWNDPRMAWNPSLRGGAYSINMPRLSVWTPEFTVINSFDTSDYLGHPKYNVQFVYDGTAVWTFSDKLRAVCNYDVLDYPFDIQTCAVALSPIGMTSSQVRLIISTSTADVTDLVERDAWEYVSSSVRVVDKDSSFYVNIEIKVSRKHGFHQLMNWSPFVMLFILNLFVLILPADSGERIGFSVVCLLGLIFYSNSILVQLPPNNNSIPKVSIFIMVVLLGSFVICILSILNKRFYTLCQQEQGSRYPKPSWKYEVTDEQKHSSVTELQSKEATVRSNCEAKYDYENVKM